MAEIEEMRVTAYKPSDFCVEVEKLFPEETEAWEVYTSTDGFLRLSPLIYFGGVGVEGRLSLGNPPSDFEVDAWEASKAAGVWDYYSMLGITSIPTGNLESSIAIYFQRNTFFERGLEVIHTWSNETSHEDLGACWRDLYKVFVERLGATTLSGKIWETANGTIFDSSFPIEGAG